MGWALVNSSKANLSQGNLLNRPILNKATCRMVVRQRGLLIATSFFAFYKASVSEYEFHCY